MKIIRKLIRYIIRKYWWFPYYKKVNNPSDITYGRCIRCHANGKNLGYATCFHDMYDCPCELHQHLEHI